MKTIQERVFGIRLGSKTQQQLNYENPKDRLVTQVLNGLRNSL
jgi:hypothetical protein